MRSEDPPLSSLVNQGAYAVLARVSPSCPPLLGIFLRVTHPSATLLAPEGAFSFDLHVLSVPPTFNLSHDQTLQFMKVCTSFSMFRCQASRRRASIQRTELALISFGSQTNLRVSHTNGLFDFVDRVTGQKKIARTSGYRVHGSYSSKRIRSAASLSTSTFSMLKSVRRGWPRGKGCVLYARRFASQAPSAITSRFFAGFRSAPVPHQQMPVFLAAP